MTPTTLQIMQTNQRFTECLSVTNAGLRSYRKCALFLVKQPIFEAVAISQNDVQAIVAPWPKSAISQTTHQLSVRQADSENL
jgi:hypothetical protein